MERVHKRKEIGVEKIVVEKQVVGDVLVGSVAGLACYVIAETYEELSGLGVTPRMASWV
jgi:hypothetical protein